MAQPVETATDYRHTHKDLGLIMVNVYGFVFHTHTKMLPNALSPQLCSRYRWGSPENPMKSANLVAQGYTNLRKIRL